MLPVQRKDEICALLREKKYLSISELCQTLHYSESTIRRDLKKMEKERLISCTRGGVISSVHPNMETPLMLRRNENHREKSSIARRAADMVGDNQIIILDASTTAMEMIPFLRNKKNLVILTCCLSTAILITEQLDCTLICSGGRYYPPVSSLVGPSAESMIKNWFADIMFFSVYAFDAQRGPTDQGEDVAHLKSVMLRQAKKTVMMADPGKFGKTGPCLLPDVNIDQIITTRDARFDDPQWKEWRKKMIFAGE